MEYDAEVAFGCILSCHLALLIDYLRISRGYQPSILVTNSGLYASILMSLREHSVTYYRKIMNINVQNRHILIKCNLGQSKLMRRDITFEYQPSSIKIYNANPSTKLDLIIAGMLALGEKRAKSLLLLSVK